MISFFANKNGSGEIRGRQMAEFLGGRLNPAEGYEDDVCIYVKRKPPDDHPVQSYLDVVDASERVGWLRRHPEIGVIASSRTGWQYLEKELGRHVKLIPQHHCNFERRRKTPRRGAPRIGVVGGRASMPEHIATLTGATRYGDYRTWRDVVDAYLQIDIQVIWRGIVDRPLKNALKIINAASFGIPTVALPEPCYWEMEGCYWRATTEAELLRTIEVLADGYDEERLVRETEQFHIEKVAAGYLSL